MMDDFLYGEPTAALIITKPELEGAPSKLRLGGVFLLISCQNPVIPSEVESLP